MNIFIIYTTENILVYTSFIFLTNVITAFYREYYLYAFLFIMLTMTSVIVHTNDNIYTNTIDKFSVFCVVIYGGNMLWNKYLVCHEFEYFIPTFMVVISFSFCIFVYIYGYLQQNYCFHSQKCIADVYHSLLHLISSFGHHLIILL
jgi:hypothetical protein